MHTRRFIALAALLLPCCALARSFTLEQVLSAPFASDLTAATEGPPRFAWVSDRLGRRNLWLAVQGGDHGFESRVLTHFDADDAQDIYDLAFAPHHPQLVFVRGGDSEVPDKPAPNPAELPAGASVEVYFVDYARGSTRKLGAGHAPTVSPDGERVLFLHQGEVFEVSLGSQGKPRSLLKPRGEISTLRFSPDGRELAIVSVRGDHSFIGVYRFADRRLRWIDPGLSLDMEPRWSPDGKRLAFLRTPYTHDEIGIGPHRAGFPWSICVADAASGQTREVYRAPAGRGSVFYPLSSDAQLFWSEDSLIFPAESDGWLHLYAVPVQGGPARLLTPGAFEVEFASASPDGRRIVYASNAGDSERRHLWELEPASGHVHALTSGADIETEPAVLSDGSSIAFLHSSVRIPLHAALLVRGHAQQELAAEGVPADFPSASLVEPLSVRLAERAGVAAHGILFLPPADAPGASGAVAATAARHPALIFMHGGPVREMLLGWHYMDYYSNAYAMNQYLASRGYVVLALNYRSGIGYGMEYREAEHYGATGASEYNDVLSAADFLRGRADVDPRRLGLWGGSYGGYLTAMGLARNSDLFAAGVDMHGVHDWHHWTFGERDDRPLYVLDAPPSVLATALASSPISAIDRWRSPVLLIAGDDDHNVPFSETARLAEALRARGVAYSALILPDEIHGFLRHESWLRAYGATAQFFAQHLR
ncbi:MAG TPA: prolyl oligopeptidase family serine peptidase [Steroidobacteraceae bacterium]|nr:prolyl oligopeptidase family serine peptidase [Steroidobacteraceae bacterium]